MRFVLSFPKIALLKLCTNAAFFAYSQPPQTKSVPQKIREKEQKGEIESEREGGEGARARADPVNEHRSFVGCLSFQVSVCPHLSLEDRKLSYNLKIAVLNLSAIDSFKQDKGTSTLTFRGFGHLDVDL